MLKEHRPRTPDGDHRDASYLFHPISVWEDAADDEPVIAASRAFADAIRPFSTGDPFSICSRATATLRGGPQQLADYGFDGCAHERPR